MARQRKQAKPAKRYQRRARRYARRYPISQGPINRTAIMKFKYVDTKKLTTGVIGIPFNAYVFKVNDLFDPDYTGIGHQSMYRDQMFAIYKYGKVLGASIKVVPSTVTLATLRVGVCPIPDGATDTDYNTAAERRLGKSRVYNSNTNTPVIKIYSSSDSYLGLSKGETRRGVQFRQTSSASIGAGQSMFYQVYVYDPIVSGTIDTFFNVEITQYVLFEEPLNILGS